MLQVHRVDILADLDHLRHRVSSNLVCAQFLVHQLLACAIGSNIRARWSLDTRENLLVRVPGNLLQCSSVACHRVRVVLLLLEIVVASRGVRFQWPLPAILVTVFLADLWPSARSLNANSVVLLRVLGMVVVHGNVAARLNLQRSPHIRTNLLPRIA